MTVFYQSLSPDILTCNKFLIHKLGLENAILLEYFLKLRNDLSHIIDENGYFHSNLSSAYAETGLPQYDLQKSLNFLIDNDLISCLADGPSTLLPIIKYKINDEKYLLLFGIDKYKKPQKKIYTTILQKFDIYFIFNIYDISRKIFKKIKKINFNQNYRRNYSIELKNKPRKARLTVTQTDTQFNIQCYNCIDLHRFIDIDKHFRKRTKQKSNKESYYMNGIERAPLVITTIDEHNHLIAKYGEERVKKCYIYLSNYLQKNDLLPKKRLKKSYFMIQNWAMEASDKCL